MKHLYFACITVSKVYPAVLGTCATFSATALLARTKKGGARRGGVNIKKMARWQWRKKVALNRAISAPFSNQI